MDTYSLRNMIYQSILELATEEGINASGKEEIYGCIFGRDSFVTILKIMKSLSNTNSAPFIETQLLLDICRRSLLTLVQLQGKETNIESGEEPGKFIHEYRKEKYERLVNRPVKPWYLYPDKILRNYDSIDSTPLGLIALYRYWNITKDDTFLLQVLPAVESGLNWIITYGDKDKDGLIEYELHKERKHGGLVVQSWTDSHESITQADGRFPDYPIAPVEAQGYAWLALKLWSDFYADTSRNYAKTENFAHKLATQAELMKKRFNEIFLYEDEELLFPAQALDGSKNQLRTVTGNSLLLLWATYYNNGKSESILDDTFIPDLVKRSFMDDLFDSEAGIRTMSTKAATYISGQNSYHNGSFWPKLNGMVHEGLTNWNYLKEAEHLKEATLKPIQYFGTPIELYVKGENGNYLPFRNSAGREGCRQQAWSAAVALDLLTL